MISSRDDVRTSRSGFEKDEVGCTASRPAPWPACSQYLAYPFRSAVGSISCHCQRPSAEWDCFSHHLNRLAITSGETFSCATHARSTTLQTLRYIHHNMQCYVRLQLGIVAYTMARTSSFNDGLMVRRASTSTHTSPGFCSETATSQPYTQSNTNPTGVDDQLPLTCAILGTKRSITSSPQGLQTVVSVASRLLCMLRASVGYIEDLSGRPLSQCRPCRNSSVVHHTRVRLLKIMSYDRLR